MALMCLFKALHLASKANVNSGVITCFFSFKLILITIFFNIFFNQKLKIFDYVGIFLGICCVLTMTGSYSVFNTSENEILQYDYFVAVSLMAVVISLLVIRDIVMKNYFAYGENNTNIVHFRVFHDLCFQSVLFIVCIYRLFSSNAFRFNDLKYTSFGGIFQFF